MKNARSLLLADSVINLVLGGLLSFFPRDVVRALGVPSAEPAFYASILGAVLFGIGLALLIERGRGGGLGLAGAIAINLCGGTALGLWLLFGRLTLPARGQILLWGLVVLLVGISAVELASHRTGPTGRRSPGRR
jgi:hypothetical protein